MIKGPTDNSIGIEVVLMFNVCIGCYLKTILGRLYLQVSVRRILVTVKYTNDSKYVSHLRTNAALRTQSQ